MSKLEHPGDRTTTSPGFAFFRAARTAASSDSNVCCGARPSHSREILAAASPIRYTPFERIRIASLTIEKSHPLSRPPAIRCTFLPNAVTAHSTDSAVVALESL